jgi:hypothetical protein
VFCGTLLGTRRWDASTGEGGTGAGAPPLRLDEDGSRDDACIRGGYGELGSARFLKANGVVSAGPMPPELAVSVDDMRGVGRLNAAAEMVRVPGGSIGEEVRDEVDLFVEPVEGDGLPSRKGDSVGARIGDSIGVRYGDSVFAEDVDETGRSERLICGGGMEF